MRQNRALRALVEEAIERSTNDRRLPVSLGLVMCLVDAEVFAIAHWLAGYPVAGFGALGRCCGLSDEEIERAGVVWRLCAMHGPEAASEACWLNVMQIGPKGIELRKDAK